MPSLRWILIVGGALLLIGIYLWGRRSSQQTNVADDTMLRIPEPSDESLGSHAFRDEPVADFSTAPVNDAGSVETIDEIPISANRRFRDSTDADVDAPAQESGSAELSPPANRDRDVRRTRIEPTLGEDTGPVDHQAAILQEARQFAAESVATVPAHKHVTAATGAAAPTLSMSNAPPPSPRRSERRKIMALRIAAGTQRFTGAQLLGALLDEDLQHGKYDVFHRLDDAGASIFSIASMVEPGTFDPARMNDETYPGITMFAQLPGPIDGLLAFNELLLSARRLQERLGGVLQDDRGVPLTIHRVERLRQDVRDFQQGQARDARQSDPSTHS